MDTLLGLTVERMESIRFALDPGEIVISYQNSFISFECESVLGFFYRCLESCYRRDNHTTEFVITDHDCYDLGLKFINGNVVINETMNNERAIEVSSELLQVTLEIWSAKLLEYLKNFAIDVIQYKPYIHLQRLIEQKMLVDNNSVNH